jgi:hypothetical protein
MLRTPRSLFLVSGLAILGTSLAPALLVSSAVAATLSQPTLPDTAPAKCAKEFIAMINDGSAAAVKKFESKWASKKRLATASIEERIPRFADLHQKWNGLEVVSLVDSSDTSITINVKTAAGEAMSMEFKLDAAEPGKFEAVMIESSGPGVKSEPLTAASRASTVENAAKALREGYVFPEVAEKMAQSVLGKLKAGEYDNIKDERALANRLTDDFRAISRDKHLGVRLAPSQGEESHHGMPDGDEMRRQNYAFEKVEVLPGNIGYLKFNLFVPTDEAKQVATSALGFLANCDAIIFDLRSNGGGSPDMIRFITSYLFDSPTLLNQMVDREGKVVEEFSTLSEVPGKRFANDLPVYVLTSHTTFSGAEEFSYNLKNLKRATIVGETTGGGAHPVRGERLNDRFMIRVPFMRAQNPISKTNWEGTGVEPDVKVPAGEALEKATGLARKMIEGKMAKK